MMKKRWVGAVVAGAMIFAAGYIFWSRTSSNILLGRQEGYLLKQRIPTAPPLLQSPQMNPANVHVQNKTDGQEILQYDNTFSFEENLDRFRRFCDANKNHPDFDLLVSTFIKSIIPISAHHFNSVSKALERLEGTAPYRNILLACLMSADASDESKANVAWGIATNLNEEVSVRRTATYLTGQVDSATKRPEAFRLLLTDPDEQVVVFALTSTNRNVNLDEANYDLIKTALINSSNVNLQVAAVNAVGTAPFADSQNVLFGIVTNASMAGVEPFSEPTLAKRSAIMLLDVNNDQTRQLLQTIALDDAEEPGVRSKAITRMATSRTPEVTQIIRELLNQLEPDNLVPLRAVVDGLLQEPSSANLSLVKDRISSITDPQVRRVLLHRVEMATKGESR